jgi:hypothetical protein
VLFIGFLISGGGRADAHTLVFSSQENAANDAPNQWINLTVDSVLLALPLQSGAFNGRLSKR